MSQDRLIKVEQFVKKVLRFDVDRQNAEKITENAGFI
jgi:hypothetical protein